MRAVGPRKAVRFRMDLRIVNASAGRKCRSLDGDIGGDNEVKSFLIR